LINLKINYNEVTVCHLDCNRCFTDLRVSELLLLLQGISRLRPDKSLARPTSQCILLDGENISFDASLVIYT